MSKKAIYGSQEIAQMRKLYYKDKLSIRQVNEKFPLASHATIANYIAGYRSGNTGAYITAVNRDESKSDANAETAKKIKESSIRLFHKIQPNQKVKLVHNRRPGEVKHFWQPILVKEGVVVQKTDSLIVFRILKDRL